MKTIFYIYFLEKLYLNMKKIIFLLLIIIGKLSNAQEFVADADINYEIMCVNDPLPELTGNYDGNPNYIKRWIIEYDNWYGSVDSVESEYGYVLDQFYGPGWHEVYFIYEVERKSDGLISRDSGFLHIDIYPPNYFVTDTVVLSYGESFQFDEFIDGASWYAPEIYSVTDGHIYHQYDLFDSEIEGVGEYDFVFNSCSEADTLHVTVLGLDTASCSENMMVFESFPAFRNGFEDTRTIRFMNGSNKTMHDVEGYILIDEYLNFVSATSEIGYVSEEGTDSIVFSIDSLPSAESMVIRINSVVPADETQMGREITFKSEVWNSCLRAVGNSVAKTVVREIRAPYDPNHKEALIGDGGMPTDTDELTYLIEFQNLGNDTAFKVVVEDTINPDYFDIQGIEMLTSSDPYEMTIDSVHNLVRWTFNDIHLVDSTTNEPESHGNFSFKIPLKSDFGLDDVAENTAYIYFDFNSAIVTNTAFNFYKNSISIDDLNKKIFLEVYQKQEELFISVSSDFSKEEEVLIVDLKGRELYSNSINFLQGVSNFSIPIGNFSDGIYLIRVGNKAVQFPVIR